MGKTRRTSVYARNKSDEPQTLRHRLLQNFPALPVAPGGFVENVGGGFKIESGQAFHIPMPVWNTPPYTLKMKWTEEITEAEYYEIAQASTLEGQIAELRCMVADVTAKEGIQLRRIVLGLGLSGTAGFTDILDEIARLRGQSEDLVPPVEIVKPKPKKKRKPKPKKA